MAVHFFFLYTYIINTAGIVKDHRPVIRIVCNKNERNGDERGYT